MRSKGQWARSGGAPPDRMCLGSAPAGRLELAESAKGCRFRLRLTGSLGLTDRIAVEEDVDDLVEVSEVWYGQAAGAGGLFHQRGIVLGHLGALADSDGNVFQRQGLFLLGAGDGFDLRSAVYGRGEHVCELFGGSAHQL